MRTTIHRQTIWTYLGVIYRWVPHDMREMERHTLRASCPTGRGKKGLSLKDREGEKGVSWCQSILISSVQLSHKQACKCHQPAYIPSEWVNCEDGRERESKREIYNHCRAFHLEQYYTIYRVILFQHGRVRERCKLTVMGPGFLLLIRVL